MGKFLTYLFAVTVIFTQAYGQTPWERDASNPVLPRGNNGEWDDALVAGPYVLFDGTI